MASAVEAGGIGAAVKRVEDGPLVTGQGQFTDDLSVTGQAHAVFVRSPHAHARLLSIRTEVARAMPGVLAVLTAEDIASQIKRPIPSLSAEPPIGVFAPDGTPARDGPQYPLARDRVRYVGEAMAVVIAESETEALDGAERVEVDYEPLPAVTTYDQALAETTTSLWPDRDDNQSFYWESGDGAPVEAIFNAADHVCEMDLTNNRVVASFMEPRAAIAEYSPEDQRFTLHVGCQGTHNIRDALVGLMEVPTDKIRVISRDVGGGFGARSNLYPEYPVLLAAAKRLGRPVRWTATRSESFLTDNQSRDHQTKAALALDGDGRFLGVRIASTWRHGAYLPSRNIFVTVAYLPPTVGSVYTIPSAHISLRGLFSNTAPMGPYRGVGRAEANYLLERLIDAAAAQIGIDRIDLRRRNLVTPAQMPWTMAGGGTITSGEFAANMDRALALVDWRGFSERRVESARQGRLRGIGLANYVENDGSIPFEYSEIGVDPAGIVLAAIGTQDFGMGHRTIYAQILSETFGIPFEAIRVDFGDTDGIAKGTGSHGSRSARMGGSAAIMGARAVIEKGLEIAAGHLEASVSDVDFANGHYTIAGTDRSVSLFDVAGLAEQSGDYLAAEATFQAKGDVQANGCHITEVSIDRDTGDLRIERHIMVADVGRAINPMIVDGQMHGGATQGLGQAVLEHVVYDRESGQQLSGSYMDFAIPRADDMPNFVVDLNEVVEADNPTGAKGAGENATTGAPAAVMNAIHDALGQVGAGPVDMPATAERIWRALSL
jgi:carbon-monoxide dehydrogenase large subunit